MFNHHSPLRGISRTLLFLVVAIALVGAQPARGDDRPLPLQLSFISSVVQLYDEAYLYPGYDHYSWNQYEFGAGNKQRGQEWLLRGTIPGSAAAPQQWAQLKAAFIQAGWSVVNEASAGGILEHKRGSIVSWAQVAINDGVRVTSIEVGPNPSKLTLKPPNGQAETFDIATQEFPYLSPLPDMKPRAGREAVQPFWVQIKDAPKPEMIAEKALVREYQRPAGLSNLQFLETYRDALARAGWAIVSESNGADASLTGHYSKSPRDLWASLHLNRESIQFAVADGGVDLQSTLGKECHVALYGVLFDFNQSTLKPESDSVLRSLLGLLEKRPALHLEIQGHTDIVGDAAYNQTLSEARAAAVVKWLNAHHIAAARLTSHGYGKSQPIADNGSDEGRAKNRRVEVVDPNCKPAHAAHERPGLSPVHGVSISQ